MQVLDLAHRGYASINDESTLNAFLFAFRVDTDGLEFDIRQTSDGVIVVSHEQKITKLNNKKVEEVIYDDIRRYTRILTFNEVVILAKKHNKPIWVEIKDSNLYPGIIDKMLKILQKHKFQHQTIVQSFNIDDLSYINKLNNNIELLKLYIIGHDYTSLPEFVRYVGFPIATGYINCNLISNIHKTGRKVIFWRESSFFEKKYIINTLIKRGADGFMIDTPLSNIIGSHE